VTRCGQYVFATDFPFDEHHELAADLQGLRAAVFATLGLPEGRTPIRIAVFADEPEFRDFLRRNFPELPARRAFFFRQGDELLVYCWRGAELRGDLRHEATHALLHSVLPAVPLWLDEGLAEYFEVGPERAAGNPKHVAALRAEIAGGWRPDLVRLERLADLAALGAMEYREAWLTVHWCLHGPPAARRALLEHLRAAGPAAPPSAADPPALAARLAAAGLEARAALEAHVLTLASAPAAPRGADYPFVHPPWWRRALTLAPPFASGRR
jgi:hypothetical protein